MHSEAEMYILLAGKRAQIIGPLSHWTVNQPTIVMVLGPMGQFNARRVELGFHQQRRGSEAQLERRTLLLLDVHPSDR